MMCKRLMGLGNLSARVETGDVESCVGEDLIEGRGTCHADWEPVVAEWGSVVVPVVENYE